MSGRSSEPSSTDAEALHAAATVILRDFGLLPRYGTASGISRLLSDTRDYRVVLYETDTARWLLKQAKAGARTQKMINAAVAARFASARGVPTPCLRCFACGVMPDRPTVQIYDYVPGESCPEGFAGMTDAGRRDLLAQLGYALARLHAHRAPGYGESLHGDGFESLMQATRQRLDYALGQSEAFSALVPGTVEAAQARILALSERVAADSLPVLVHGDVGPRNLILDAGRLAALIDFEHAKFHDAAHDFVKLHFLLSGRAEDWRALMGAYSEKAGTPARFAERLSMFIGLELLSGLGYWHRTSDAAMFDDYRARLRHWLDTAPTA
jgi:aminoglycoside phosphotransferase (APT) family kinase protein